MAWDSIGSDRYGGDLPLDAFSGALARAIPDGAAPRPDLAEVLDAAVAALASAGLRPDGPSWDALRRASAAPARPVARPEPPRTGDVLAIPYDGPRAVVALVLFGDDARGAAGAPGCGPCVVPFDLDLGPDGLPDPDELRRTPWLLAPAHPGHPLPWPTLGRVTIPLDPAVLPLFAAGERPGRSGRAYVRPYPRGYVEVVRDYFGAVVPDGPGIAARVVPQQVGGFGAIVEEIRARRGLAPARPDHRAAPAGHPLSGWARLSFVDAGPAPPAGPTPGAHADALRHAFTDAIARCREGWQARWDRDPDAEELGHALLAVLVAHPARSLSDPGRPGGR